MSARPTSRRIARRGMAVAAYTLVLIALAAVAFSNGSEGAPPVVRPSAEPRHQAHPHRPTVVAPRHRVVSRRRASALTRRVIPPPPPVALAIDHQGNGDGTVVVLGGARCSGDCTIDITRGRVVTLTAHASAGARFDGWTAPAACRATPTCNIQVRGEMTVAARWTATTRRSGNRDRTVTARSRVVLITSVTGDHGVLRVRGH